MQRLDGSLRVLTAALPVVPRSSAVCSLAPHRSEASTSLVRHGVNVLGVTTGVSSLTGH